MLFTEPTFLFLFLPLLLGLYFIRGIARACGLRQLAAAGRERDLLRQGRRRVHLADARLDRLQLLDGDCRRPRARHAGRARRRLAFAVTVNLVVLGIFKYANFFADNVNALLQLGRVQPIAVPRVLLPIGISFFTFHAISYVIDVSRRDATAQKSPVHAALYLLLFPQLIAGPIIRYRDIADQLARRVVSIDDFAYGVRRFVIGLAKKVLIANVVAGPADKIFALPAAELSTAHAWLGIVCYTLQIYFDFSGYSDMAIGLGRMFGFRFPENFRWPYVATSVHGVLAPLAHLAVDLVPRLPLHPARRQPRQPGASLREPGHGVLSVRPLARRQLELRDLGPVARRVPRHRTPRPIAAFAQAITRLPDYPITRCRCAGVADLAARLHDGDRDDRLGLLPRRHAGRRDRVSASRWPG